MKGVLARRLGVVVLCVLSLVVCVGLAWWQWQRFESASGSWQNLGYVLQWPLFGLFPAFMFWRLRKLRAQHSAHHGAHHGAHDQAQPAAEPPSEPAPERPRPPQTRHDDGDDDPELAAYNRYLAQLNAMDQETR